MREQRVFALKMTVGRQMDDLIKPPRRLVATYLYPNDQHQLDVCCWLYGPQSKIHQDRKDPLHHHQTAQDRQFCGILHGVRNCQTKFVK